MCIHLSLGNAERYIPLWGNDDEHSSSTAPPAPSSVSGTRELAARVYFRLLVVATVGSSQVARSAEE